MSAEPKPRDLPLGEKAHFPRWPAHLQTEVVRATKNFPGELHLYVKDIEEGGVYSYNAETPTYLASGVKILFMVELFRQLEAGQLSLDEKLIYENWHARDGSPFFNLLPIKTPVSLRMVLEAMIQQSDNAASDMIAERVGIDRINETVRSLGYNFGPMTTLIEVRRLIYESLDKRVRELSPEQVRSIALGKNTEARVLKITNLLGELPGTYTIPELENAYRRYYELGYNSAPISEMGGLLEAMVHGKIISERASRQMLEVMLGTRTGPKRVLGHLPRDTPFAHKTGTQYARMCDFGVLYLPTARPAGAAISADRRPVVLCMCTKGAKRQQAEELMARVGRKVYDLLEQPPPLVAAEALKDGPGIEREPRRKRGRRSN